MRVGSILKLGRALLIRGRRIELPAGELSGDRDWIGEDDRNGFSTDASQELNLNLIL